MPDLEQVVPYLGSVRDIVQEPPAAIAEMPELMPDAEDEATTADAAEAVLEFLPGAEVADGAASKTLAADKELEVGAELALTVPVWFNPEEAAL